ncbi:hypothetical protein BaRGS_00004892 [Batillaria attramentaria]|uniref:Uncharacterized protein n=1 Tax=Batillaria attramentaria TaxID=370345 RepID=A0ABD0LXJ7_9CAEN
MSYVSCPVDFLPCHKCPQNSGNSLSQKRANSGGRRDLTRYYEVSTTCHPTSEASARQQGRHKTLSTMAALSLVSESLTSVVMQTATLYDVYKGRGGLVAKTHNVTLWGYVAFCRSQTPTSIRP